MIRSTTLSFICLFCTHKGEASNRTGIIDILIDRLIELGVQFIGFISTVTRIVCYVALPCIIIPEICELPNPYITGEFGCEVDFIGCDPQI